MSSQKIRWDWVSKNATSWTQKTNEDEPLTTTSSTFSWNVMFVPEEPSATANESIVALPWTTGVAYEYPTPDGVTP